MFSTTLKNFTVKCLNISVAHCSFILFTLCHFGLISHLTECNKIMGVPKIYQSKSFRCRKEMVRILVNNRLLWIKVTGCVIQSLTSEFTFHFEQSWPISWSHYVSLTTSVISDALFCFDRLMIKLSLGLVFMQQVTFLCSLWSLFWSTNGTLFQIHVLPWACWPGRRCRQENVWLRDMVYGLSVMWFVCKMTKSQTFSTQPDLGQSVDVLYYYLHWAWFWWKVVTVLWIACAKWIIVDMWDWMAIFYVNLQYWFP